MLRLKLVILFSILLVTTSGFSQQADEIIGKYRLPNKLDVEIFKSSHTYYGKIIALNGYDNGQVKDFKNPDKSRQNDPLLGKVIIEGLAFDIEEKEWIDGRMYGPEKGMVFNLKITDVREDEIEAVGSKYFFWKTISWQRLLE